MTNGDTQRPQVCGDAGARTLLQLPARGANAATATGSDVMMSQDSSTSDNRKRSLSPKEGLAHRACWLAVAYTGYYSWGYLQDRQDREPICLCSGSG